MKRSPQPDDLGRRAEQQIDDEMTFHRTRLIADLEAAGWAPDAALEEADRRFGYSATVQRELVEGAGVGSRGRVWSHARETLQLDLRSAVRMLRRSPGFIITAVGSLAAAVALTSASFALIDSLRYTPLPYPQQDQLVVFGEVREGNNPWYFCCSRVEAYRQWRAKLRSVDRMTGASSVHGRVERPDGTLLSMGMAVAPDYFEMFAIPTSAGRVLVPNDDRPEAALVAVVTSTFAQLLFGDSTGVVGRTFSLRGFKGDRRVFEIVGVAPAGTEGSMDQGFWISLEREIDHAKEIGALTSMLIFGRLEEGRSIKELRSELALKQHPRTEGSELPQLTVGVYRDYLLRDWANSDLLLGAVTLGILLIAAANLASLMLVRTLARSRELAIRAALGSGTRRLVRLLLIESGLVIFASGALGVWGAVAVAEGLRYWLADLRYWPPWADVTIDIRVGIFALGVGAVTALACSWPLLHVAMRADLQSALRGTAHHSSHDARTGRLRRMIVAAEIAAAVILMAAAGTFARTYLRAIHTDAGYDDESLVSFRVGDWTRWSPAVAEATRERLLTTPGVEDVVRWAYGSPADASFVNGEAVASLAPSRGPLQGFYPAITDANVFTVARIPFLAGRTFDATETQSPTDVVVINEHLAQLAFPGAMPIDVVGRRLRFGSATDTTGWFGVIGVVRNSLLFYDSNPAEGRSTRAQAFMPFVPQRDATNEEFMLRLAPVGQEQTITSIRTMLREGYGIAERDISIAHRARHQEAIFDSLRKWATLVGMFGIAGLSLAAIGVYGLVAYGVRQRRAELAIRMALGSSRGAALGTILRDGLAMVTLGLVTGVAFWAALSRLLAATLWNADTTPLSVMLAVALVLLGATVAACYFPARRALAIDPMTALRDG